MNEVNEQRTSGDDGRDVGDAGLSTIEVVILAPVMILFILVLVAFGQLVHGRSSLDSGARDAARAGSLQRDLGSAMAEAREAAAADLDGICTGPVHVTSSGGAFEPGGMFSVEVSCQVRGLATIGLTSSTELTARASSPIDPFRRAG